MEIILNDEYKVLISGKNLGYIGEMNSRTITFENYLCEGADRYIMRLVYPDDVAYDVDISSGKYTVEASLLRDFKYCNAQILAVKSSGDNYIYVKKSNIFAFMISQSLNGDKVEPIPTYEQALSKYDELIALVDGSSTEFTSYVDEKKSEMQSAVDTSETEFNTYLSNKKTEVETSIEQIATALPESTAGTLQVQINALQSNKVDKVAGKGLSTNDLTNELKTSYDKAVEQTETNKADIASLTERVDNDEKAISKINSDMVALHADNLALVFALQRTGKVYGVKAYKYPVNPTSTCEKTRDNAGLVCEPSTDTVEGVDDYADIPLFKYYHCNYKRYDDGFAYPTAFEGETDYQSSGDVDIGCLQMTFYYGEIETDEYVETLISDSPNDALGLKPWELSVRADGTVMPYFIQPKYVSVTGSDGLLHSTVGRIAMFQSYGNMITNYQKKGTGYWGAGSSRYTFAQIFYRIKYGTKASDDNFMGVTNWNIQYKASVQSSDKHTYFPVTNAQASNLQAGLCVSVGYPNSSGNTDRGNTEMHKYANDVKITAIETLDDNNKAVYLDCEPFTTAPLDDGREIYMSSMQAHSGDTDCVIGHHDGSPISNKDGKHPFRLQGLEYALGVWLVASDAVMFFNTDYSKDVYVANGATHTTNETTIKSTYTKIGTIPASANGNGSDYWTGDVAHIDGGWYPYNEATSTTGNKDNLWAGGKNTGGLREFLQGGFLGNGSSAGLCHLHCGGGLGAASWHYASAD